MFRSAVRVGHRAAEGSAQDGQDAHRRGHHVRAVIPANIRSEHFKVALQFYHYYNILKVIN